MSSTDREWTPSEEYMAKIIIAALTNCDDEDQASDLVAQQVALGPHIDRVIAEAGELLENHQARQAIPLLDEMIDRVGRFTRPYPPAVVQEVFAYPLTRLHFQRALLQFTAASTASDLKTALADLDRASSYPTSTFAELDPELLVAIRDFRPILQAGLQGQQTFEKRESGPAAAPGKSGKCFIATAAYGSELAPEVMTLRRFRETSLRPHAAGRWFIRCYERCSPPLAAAIAGRPAARLWVRRLLLRPLLRLIDH